MPDLFFRLINIEENLLIIQWIDQDMAIGDIYHVDLLGL